MWQYEDMKTFLISPKSTAVRCEGAQAPGHRCQFLSSGEQPRRGATHSQSTHPNKRSSSDDMLIVSVHHLRKLTSVSRR